VEFDTVTVNTTENVFFLNLDEEAHFPTICPNPVGRSLTSIKCVPQPEYGCKYHGNEKGIINIL
jgi:hypothetical protein